MERRPANFTGMWNAHTPNLRRRDGTHSSPIHRGATESATSATHREVTVRKPGLLARATTSDPLDFFTLDFFAMFTNRLDDYASFTKVLAITLALAKT